MNDGGFDLLKFGAADSVILALMPQLGEQVDILRFLPVRDGKPGRSWRFTMLAAGRGWIVLGTPKLLLGSFLAVLALPRPLVRHLQSGVAAFLGIFAAMVGAIALVLLLIHYRTAIVEPQAASSVANALIAAFFVLAIVAGIAAWFFVLQRQSRRVAQEETQRQTTMLLDEIASHRRTDAALQEAKERAEAASEAKSRYVVGMAHELRTPLNTVLGYAQLLERDEAVPAPERSSVRVIRSSAEHLSGLIDGLLDISKIESGRLQLNRGLLRLPDFLDALADMFAMQAQAKGLTFTVTRAPNLPEFVRNDEKRLRQILINLLSNAVKFTEFGSVILHIAYRNQVATFTVTTPGRPRPRRSRRHASTAVPAHGPRGRDRAVAGARQVEPGHRRDPVDEPPNGEQAPRGGLREARRREPGLGRRSDPAGDRRVKPGAQPASPLGSA